MVNQQDRNLFLTQVCKVFDVPSLRELADAVATLDSPEVSRSLMAACNQISPFFVPHAREGQQVAMSQFQWLEAITQARLAAASAHTPRVIVSAPMKSGSTFVADSISRGFSLPKVSMMMLLARPYDYAPLGAGNRPHEIDEMALLSACLNGVGFASHHHMICTPFLAKQAELYKLKFVLLKRNIFDCILSLDEFCVKHIAARTGHPAAYIVMQLPSGFTSMPQDERIHCLLNRYLGIYVQYHVSWKYFEQSGSVDPFWISYEHELLADKPRLAARLCDWMMRPAADEKKLLAQFVREDDLKNVNFNKGVAGRGSVIQGENRQRVVDAFNDFKDLADWTEILD
jgi:hypothetical protein